VQIYNSLHYQLIQHILRPLAHTAAGAAGCGGARRRGAADLRHADADAPPQQAEHRRGVFAAAAARRAR
jgi:hypothetical protein